MNHVLESLLERGLEEPQKLRTRFRYTTFAMGKPRLPLDKAIRITSALKDDETARKLLIAG